ncbi:MAG: hypothetical protein ACFFCD_11940 [Promethearchaeota archaeon]
MTEERPRKGFGKEMSRGLTLATGLPIMIIFGVIVGYYLGRDYGIIWAGIGALIGGLLGLAWVIVEVQRWYPSKPESPKNNDQ